MSVKEFVLSDAQWQEIQQRKKSPMMKSTLRKKTHFVPRGCQRIISWIRRTCLESAPKKTIRKIKILE